VLGVWVGPRLSWGPHVKEVLVEMETHTRADAHDGLHMGDTFAGARQIYTAIIRPALTYGSSVWHSNSTRHEGRRARAAGSRAGKTAGSNIYRWVFVLPSSESGLLLTLGEA
jgi:hypothetical protein